ncbi:baseplate J/gp47 family protein [Microbispora sp. NPDC049633]|uniref:baseplate J/gp47 family protein n=1 Tax=Microbispora sp. NPDC049633 TaxID=3154355 RepID=UPI003418F961
MADAQPVSLDYTARDYDAVVAELIRRGQQVLPNWQPKGEGDFVLLLTQIMASSTDLANYYIDRVLGESTLATASTRQAVLSLAEQVGYITHARIPATAQVTLVTDTGAGDILVPRGTQVITDYVAEVDGPIVFETDDEVTVPANGGTATVNVTEGRTVRPYQLGVGTAESNQTFTLPNQGVIEGSVRVWVEAPHANIEWVRITRMIDAAPTDRVFITRQRPDGSTMIVFGSGVNGYIPELGARIYVAYRIGVGKAGNLAAGRIRLLASDTLTGVQVARDNSGKAASTAAVGGADEEANDEIRRNAPQAFAAQQRCVTTDDFARLALEVPGVSAARAVSARSGSVTCYLTGPDRSVPSALLMQTVQDHLQSHALAGTKVVVAAPTFVKVNFGSADNPLRIYVAPGWRDILVKASVETALTNLFRSDAVTFGTRMTLSQVYTSLASVPGVININIPIMARADAPQSGADDAVMADYELPVLGTVEIATVGGVITPV